MKFPYDYCSILHYGNHHESKVFFQKQMNSATFQAEFWSKFIKFFVLICELQIISYDLMTANNGYTPIQWPTYVDKDTKEVIEEPPPTIRIKPHLTETSSYWTFAKTKNWPDCDKGDKC